MVNKISIHLFRLNFFLTIGTAFGTLDKSTNLGLGGKIILLK